MSIAEFQIDKHLQSRQKDEEIKGQSGYQLEDKLDNPVEHPDSSGRTIAVAEHFGHSNVWEAKSLPPAAGTKPMPTRLHRHAGDLSVALAQIYKQTFFLSLILFADETGWYHDHP